MKTLILFDLEETLIESFDDAAILTGNVNKIKRAIDARKFAHDLIASLAEPPEEHTFEFGWMSWAIWEWTVGEYQLATEVIQVLDRDHDFNCQQRWSTLSDWSMVAWANLILKHTRSHFKRSELSQYFSKEDILLKVREEFKEFDRVILFDDTVEHGLTIESSHCTIEFQNIKDMNQ